MASIRKVQYSTFETNDFEGLQEAATDWDQEYIQLSPGKFSGGMELTEIGSTQVMREKWVRRIRYRGVGVPGGFAFAIPFEQADPADWLGRTVGQSTVMVQSPHQEGQLISGEVWDSLVLSFSTDEVQSIVRALSGGLDLTSSLHGSIELSQEDADWLRRAGRDLLKKTRQICGDKHMRCAAQTEQFKKLFLWRLVDALDRSPAQSPQSRKADIVQQATDLVFADPTAIVGLTDICDHLQISLRALHYAFHDVAGMSPATWLRRNRLNHVHRTLKHATPQETKIKRVAAEHGFLHLGHFSNQYQRFFGQLPSQTLRTT